MWPEACTSTMRPRLRVKTGVGGHRHRPLVEGPSRTGVCWGAAARMADDAAAVHCCRCCYCCSRRLGGAVLCMWVTEMGRPGAREA